MARSRRRNRQRKQLRKEMAAMAVINDKTNTKQCIKCRRAGHMSTLHGRASFIVPESVLSGYYLGRVVQEMLTKMGYVSQCANGKRFFYCDVTDVAGNGELATLTITSSDIVNLFNCFRAEIDELHQSPGYGKTLARAYAGLMERLIFDSLFARGEVAIDGEGGVVDHLLASAGDIELSEVDYDMLALIDAALNNSIVTTEVGSSTEDTKVSADTTIDTTTEQRISDEIQSQHPEGLSDAEVYARLKDQADSEVTHGPITGVKP